MANKIILAVAGSGKTTHIVNSVDARYSCLVLTYTDNNHKNLVRRIADTNPEFNKGSRIFTYFSFLYAFCLRPLCGEQYGLTGINFEIPPAYTRRLPRSDLNHYFDGRRRIYSSRIASFIINMGMVEEVKNRIDKYFRYVYVDEVQDFSGYDFELLSKIQSSVAEYVFVGDFYQHTYDTSRDGNVNVGLYKDFQKYKDRFKKMGFIVDEDTLTFSYRCSPTTCAFVSNKMGIDIKSHLEEVTTIEYVDSQSLADKLFLCDDVVKLFYKEHALYGCFSENWGASKGVDIYDRVCVVLNKNSDKFYREGRLDKLAPITRNKLYVACTRARSALYFVPDQAFNKYKRTLLI